MGIFDKDKKNTFLVYGMGISGKGVAGLLKEKGANIVLYDKNESLDMEEVKREIGLDKGTGSIQGKLTAADFEGIDIVALSPGVSIYSEDVELAARCGVQILGEVEIAYEASKGRLIAITGTNGKTTTTSLVGEIMKAAQGEVFVVGNIGYSYAQAAPLTTEKSVSVAEISSFQLETIKEFHPDVSAILNITPDHLDRHRTFENYAKTKCRIAENQTEKDFCVINYDDEYLRALTRDIRPRKIYFSRKEKPENGVFFDGKDIILNREGKDIRVISRGKISLMGDHNVENVMAAVGIAAAFGVDTDTIARSVSAFKAVEHRIEYVCEKKGVSYYNDSKGTNTDASGKAVCAMTAPCVLIAGGYDKGADYEDWINSFDGRVKAMVLIGQTAEKIKETAEGCGFCGVYMAGNLKDAVKKCAEISRRGDAVLLSPACASWDQFKSYEERGRLFKELVRELPD